MLVRDVMSKNVKSIDENDLVSKAARMMTMCNIGALPVTSEGKIIGMLTDRDIVLRCVALGKSADNQRVCDIMSTGAAFVTPNQTVSDALTMMAGEQVRRLPVVEEARVTGMISIGDIARMKENDTEIAKALSEISQND